MNKQQYIQKIRKETAYPAYRGIIGLVTILGFIMAGLIALGSLIMGVASMGNSFLMGLFIILTGAVYAAIIFVLAKFTREASLIVADIGDSITEANSRDI